MVLAFLLTALPVCLVAQQPPQPDQTLAKLVSFPEATM